MPGEVRAALQSTRRGTFFSTVWFFTGKFEIRHCQDKEQRGPSSSSQPDLLQGPSSSRTGKYGGAHKTSHKLKNHRGGSPAGGARPRLYLFSAVKPPMVVPWGQSRWWGRPAMVHAALLAAFCNTALADLRCPVSPTFFCATPGQPARGREKMFHVNFGPGRPL